MRVGGELRGRVRNVGRIAGVGFLGVAGVVGVGAAFSQTAFAGTASNTVSCLNSSGSTVQDGTVANISPTPGSNGNALGDPVLICATSANGSVVSRQTLTFKVWQVDGGSGQQTSLNGYVVLDLKGGQTVSIYVKPTTVTGQGDKKAESVTIYVPSSVPSTVSVVGGYFHGEVSSSSSKNIKLEYKIKSGGTSDLAVTGHAWIDPPTPLGSPVAPLLGSDGLEIVGLIGIASAATAAVVIRRRQLARNSTHE